MPHHLPPPYQLPETRTFQQLLLPYLGPYFVYVALSSLPDGLLAPTLAQLSKLVATTAVMGIYFGTYRFGRLTVGQAGIALMAFPVALMTWLGPLLLMKSLGFVDSDAQNAAQVADALYFWLRLVNSVILVAVFEELLMRVFVMQWLHQAGQQRGEKSFIGALLDTLDQHPERLSALPLSTSLVFAAGHRASEYPAAIAYFLFTTWVYQKTDSLWVCIFIHGLSNLAIAILVCRYGMAWLW